MQKNNHVGVMLILLALLLAGQSSFAREKINPRDVKIVNATDANWCAVEEKCKYVKRYDCRRNRAKQAHCDKRVKKDVARYGANTFVYQFAGEVEDVSVFDEESGDGPAKYYLGFGHAYYCSGDSKNDSESAYSGKLPKEVHRMQFFTQDKHDRCDFARSCRFIKSLECGTARSSAEQLCKRKLTSKALKLSGNRLVIKNEIRNDKGYRVDMDLYRCDL